MNQRSPENLHAPDDADLARLYVDGELTGEARQEFEARLAAEPTLRDRVEFERRLKQRVVALMRDDSYAAPAGLADRVRTALDEVTEPAELAPSVVGVIGPGGDRASDDAAEHTTGDRETAPRRSFFGGPARANIFAVAASLLIIGGVVLVGIFGPNIDSVGRPGSGAEQIRQAAIWVDGQHTECTVSSEYVEQKLSMPASELHDAVARHLGVTDVMEFDFGSMGYHFVGAGYCHVPGSDRSAHLLYLRDLPNRPPAMFSVFVAPEQGQYGSGRAGGMHAGEWFTVMESGDGTKAVYAYSDGVLVYFITACDPGDVAGLAKLIQQQTRGLE